MQTLITLPTFDEVAGRLVDESDYNEYILNTMKNAMCDPPSTSVYTIHTEVEGGRGKNCCCPQTGAQDKVFDLSLFALCLLAGSAARFFCSWRH